MIKLAPIFQSGMVLQRQKPIRIWGETSGQQTITAWIENDARDDSNQTEPVSVHAGGAFELFLPSEEAAENVRLHVKGSEDDELILDQVDIGEVWVAGGQSNMEFMLQYDREADTIIPQDTDEHFRFFDVGEFCFEGEREENLKFLASHWDTWHAFEPAEAPYFSAVSTFFALKLRDKLQIPVGIVGCNWGGTSASCWVPEEDLREDDKLKVYMEEYDAAFSEIKDLEKYYQSDAAYRARTNSETGQKTSDNIMKNESVKPASPLLKVIMPIFLKMHPMGPHHEWRPAGVYYTMLRPIAGFTARGFLFYQGCSDDTHAKTYAHLMEVLIRRWRKDWKEELPFLFVQLAPFGEWNASTGKNYPILRAQQQYAADHIPNCHMASIMDAGSRYDIHPKTKRQPGERLAALALHYVYQDPETTVFEAPRIRKVQRDGDRLIVKFDYAPEGLELVPNDSEFSGLDFLFRVWADRKAVKFHAEIEEDTVILSSPKIQEAKEVYLSFANRPYCIVNLKAKNGFPARPYPKRKVV